MTQTTKNVAPLTLDEQKELLRFSEAVWKDLSDNNLGGYSGINRPFYLCWMFREVIEKYRNRNLGSNLTREQLEKL